MDDNRKKILIVDDDVEIVNAIEIFLLKEGFEIRKAYDGLQALDAVAQYEIDLILMDIMMPKLDGLRATMKIREDKNIPILVISAKSQDSDKILGLDLGADDYITKPFNPLELVARVKSHLKRYDRIRNENTSSLNEENSQEPEFESSPNQLINGDLILDLDEKIVLISGEKIHLTSTEYKILEFLMQNPGKVFSIDQIYESVWNEPSYNSENTVAVHIRRIREKIEINPKDPRYLKVVWGLGYKMEKLEKIGGPK